MAKYKDESKIPKEEKKVATYVPKAKKTKPPKKEKFSEVKVVLVKPYSLIVLLNGHNAKIPMVKVVGNIKDISIGDTVKIRV